MKKVVLRIYQSALALLLLLVNFHQGNAQIVINEGSNKNHSTLQDEDNEFPDWIEILNTSADTVSLLNYSLSENANDPLMWTFPNIKLPPGEFLPVFCSEKNRKPVSAFINVVNTGEYTPVVGWNTHTFTTPFYWDGVSNILINTCAFNTSGYTSSSVLSFSNTSFSSTVSIAQDGNPAICGQQSGNTFAGRVNMQLNGVSIGTENNLTSATDYPTVPYGNWYQGNKNQYLILASELSSAGLMAGNITTIGFEVISTDLNTVYEYVSFGLKLVVKSELTSVFDPEGPYSYLHTNFKISSSGESVFLFAPDQTLLSSIYLDCQSIDISKGSFPDGAISQSLFFTPTPVASNNSSDIYDSYLMKPTYSIGSGIYGTIVNVTIENPNPSSLNSQIFYTVDGSDPTVSSTFYTGGVIPVYFSTVIKAQAFAVGMLPSAIAAHSYLIGINHTTPVLSIVTDNTNLYGGQGIFDNWWSDMEKPSHVDYFDTDEQLVFSQNAGIQIDGGAGGSRSHPQHSMRVEMDDPVLGEGSIDFPIIPNRPNRTKYSKFYLRNGSNMYLSFPYKDAVQEELMGAESNVYYSAWRPISVYINGSYFGLYELREKFDVEFFEEKDNANEDSTDILSLSYWGGGMLRSITGVSVDSFFVDYNAFTQLNTGDTDFWTAADNYFDLTYYTDYIISESWMSNHDWPYNNIKIYRSDATDYRWRFATLDLESGLNPGGWNDHTDDHIGFMLSQAGYPYSNIWIKSMENARYRNYFINRYADLMNTAYHLNRLLPVEQSFFDQSVIEMQKEYTRWGNPFDIPAQMNEFITNHEIFRSELEQRSDVVRSNVVSNFNLVGTVDVTLNVFPENAGRIKISTIVPDSLPWTGIYFNGNPVQIIAIANPGYDFAYWDINSLLATQELNDTIQLDITANELFNAVFTVNPNVGRIEISEINYHSSDTWNAGDWIELHNYGNGELDLSGYYLKDNSQFTTFNFPLGTKIQSNERYVLCSDTLLFHQQYPEVEVFGVLDFSLSNSNESITLFNAFEDTAFSVHYYDSLPWPSSCDGGSYTLERVNSIDNSMLSSNWMTGCIGGSPGEAYSTPCLEAGIEEESLLSFSVYPNPNTGHFSIRMNGIQGEVCVVEIISILGETVFLQKIDDNTQAISVNLSNSSDGIYFVKVSNDQVTKTLKMNVVN